MGKHLDAFNAATFRAPWEGEDGSDNEIDKPKLKAYIKNLLKDKATNQDRADEAEEALEPEKAKAKEADKARKAAEKALADSDESGRISDLQSKADEAEKAASEATARATAAEGKVLRLQVGEEKGLTNKQALRLQGDTEEELNADADEMLELFGIKPSEVDPDDDPEDDDDLNPLRQSPKRVVGPNGRRTDESNDADLSDADIQKLVGSWGGGNF